MPLLPSAPLPFLPRSHPPHAAPCSSPSFPSCWPPVLPVVNDTIRACWEPWAHPPFFTSHSQTGCHIACGPPTTLQTCQAPCFCPCCASSCHAPLCAAGRRPLIGPWLARQCPLPIPSLCSLGSLLPGNAQLSLHFCINKPHIGQARHLKSGPLSTFHSPMPLSLAPSLSCPVTLFPRAWKHVPPSALASPLPGCLHDHPLWPHSSVTLARAYLGLWA